MDNDTSDTRSRAVPIMNFSFQPLNRKNTYFKAITSCTNSQFTRKKCPCFR